MKMKKTKQRISKRQREIIIGTLLGDGHLETQNHGRTYRLKVEHSVKQKDYIEWLFSELRSLCAQSELTHKVRSDGREFYEFRTRSLGALRFYAHQFYDSKKKIVPKMIHKLLRSSLSLAVWFADDGSRKSLRHKTYILHTLAFTKRDLKLLQNALVQNFQIESSIHRNRNGFRIYILSKSAKKFDELIRPHLENIKSLKQKLVTQMPKK